MRRVLLRHRLAAGTSRHISEPAPRRPPFQRAELPFSPQCCRVSIRAGRTRRPRTQQPRPLHPTPLVSPRNGSSFRHLGWERGNSPVSVQSGNIARSERAKIDSETTQTTLARLNCRISAMAPANPCRPRSREHDEIDRCLGAIGPARASDLPRDPWAIALEEQASTCRHFRTCQPAEHHGWSPISILTAGDRSLIRPRGAALARVDVPARCRPAPGRANPMSFVAATEERTAPSSRKPRPWC